MRSFFSCFTEISSSSSLLSPRTGLDGRPRTLEEIGQGLHVTRERIRQIETRALQKLRSPTVSRKMVDYLSLDLDPHSSSNARK